ncbi:DNA/RNA non-specific endonuclease [Campylobacter jejuni]
MNIINEFFVSFILIKLYFKFKVCRKIKFPLLWKFYFSKWKFYFSADKLEAENLKGEQIKKRPRFEDDTNIPKKYRTTWSDYKNSGYDRGHTISNASMRKTTQAQRSTFLMSNITPQNPQINQKVWNKIEKRERQVALKLGEIEVLNLVNYDSNPQRIRNQIAIPSSYTKILKGDNFKECYQVPNHEVEVESIKSYKVDCDK